MKKLLPIFGIFVLIGIRAGAATFYVNASNPVPTAPFSTWSTAATNIQDAIDASTNGDLILVTNGVYQYGGKVMAGNLTNRVALNKAVQVMSVNGYATTVIQGAWDATSTNGPGAVRCAYLADGASLTGFTLRNGATRVTGDSSAGGPLESGGGVWCNSTNGVVSNCVLSNNCAIYGAGFIYGTLNNSLVFNNVAAQFGGGEYNATLNNCTVISNSTTTSASYHGAGTYLGIIRNSIVLSNYANFASVITQDNWDPLGGPPGFPFPYVHYYFSCSTHALNLNTTQGSGNFTLNPQFLDLYHIAATSPCRGAGLSVYASGTDLDGEPWSSPPSVGCDEVVPADLVGPLTVNIQASQTNVLVNRSVGFSGIFTGRASGVSWSFGDGTTTNNPWPVAYQWTNAGNYTVTFTAYNNDNPAGVSTNLVMSVQPLAVPQLQSGVLTNGFQFQFAAQTNATYVIQYTTNLVSSASWQTLQTINNSGGGVLQINDTNTSDVMRFYRVLVQ